MIAADECNALQSGVVFMRGLSSLLTASAAAAVAALSPGLASASTAAPAVPGIAFVSPIASGYAALPKGAAQPTSPESRPPSSYRP
jgi:hypothetical protein